MKKQELHREISFGRQKKKEYGAKVNIGRNVLLLFFFRPEKNKRIFLKIKWGCVLVPSTQATLVACKSVQSLGAVNDDARGAPTLITSFLLFFEHIFLLQRVITRCRWILFWIHREILKCCIMCDSSFWKIAKCLFSLEKNRFQLGSEIPLSKSFGELLPFRVWFGYYTLGYLLRLRKERVRAVTLLTTAAER